MTSPSMAWLIQKRRSPRRPWPSPTSEKRSTVHVSCPQAGKLKLKAKNRPKNTKCFLMSFSSLPTTVYRACVSPQSLLSRDVVQILRQRLHDRNLEEAGRLRVDDLLAVGGEEDGDLLL